MKLNFALILLIFLTACNDNGSAKMNNISPIEIQLHSPIKSTIEKSPIEFSKECMSELELCWYKIDKSANDKNLPTIAVKNIASTLTVDQITGISILIDERVGDKIENIAISLRGLPDNNTHEDYKVFIEKLIENIKSAGWQYYYYPHDPRIAGSQASKIDTPDKVLGASVLSHPWLDPDYPTTIDRWLKISPFYNWYFYNDGAYLHLKAWRHDSKDNPTKTGTYLITLELMTERDFWVSGFSEDNDKAMWKELLPARLKSYQESRRIVEEKARAKGIEIDENYQNPPIKALE